MRPFWHRLRRISRNARPGQHVTVTVWSQRAQSVIAVALTSLAWALWGYVPDAVPMIKPKSPITGEVTIPKKVRDLHYGLCYDKGGIGDMVLHPNPDVFTFYCANGWSVRHTLVRLK